MAEVTGLSGDALAALTRGEAFMVYGRRLPKDAGCVLGVATGFVPFAWVFNGLLKGFSCVSRICNCFFNDVRCFWTILDHV